MKTTYAATPMYEQSAENQKLSERRSIQLPLEEKIQLFDQLATEMDSGTPLILAIQTRVKEFDYLHTKHTDRRAFLIGGKPQGEAFVREMNVLLGDLGKPFYEAAEQFPGVFDPQFLAVIKAAQQTGNYGPALRRQVQYFTEQKILGDHIKSVLRYPVMVLSLALVVLVIALNWIVPVFEVLYKDLVKQSELPWATQMVMDLSKAFTNNWPIILLIFSGSIGGYLWARKTLPNVRRGEHFLFLRTPKINRYLVLIDTLNFLNSFILMREAGETMTKAFMISVESMTNSELREAAREAALNFEMGAPQYIHLALGACHPVFSEASTLYSQLKTYEEYADLSQLERFARILKHNADKIRDELTSFIQPASMILIGFIVGFLVFSMYIPIFELIGRMSGGK